MNILIVDDESTVCVMIENLLKARGWKTRSAGTLAQARAALAEAPADIVILDKNLPDGSGLELAEELHGKDCEVILMTAYASLDSAIQAVRLHIADYLTKPFDSLRAVKQRVENVAESLTLRRRNRELIDELQATNADLEGLVVRDPLTGLFNHGFFQEVVDREVTLARRHRHPLSLIFIDVDRFKDLNQSHGHRAGDALLKRFAELVRGDIRATDIPFRLSGRDVAARYGADRIALVLPHTDKRGAAFLAESVRATVERHGFADLALGRPVTVSIGLATFPSDVASCIELTHAAQLALAAAKRGGRNCIWSYSPALLSNGNLDEVELARRQALVSAITQGGFDYFFQPIFNADCNVVYGYEALVRPRQDAFRGPGELLATAESIGRVNELGRTLREAALGSVLDLPSPYVLFVNLHPHELNDPHLSAVEEAVDEHRERIVFEVTEVSQLPDFDHITRQLGPLRDRGYRIALDDLGAEYSGLQALAQLGPDFVKLDTYLARRVREDSRTRRLVRHLVDFATEEGILVVAEGIETAAERNIMLDLGCTLMQGYYFGKPSATWSHT